MSDEITLDSGFTATFTTELHVLQETYGPHATWDMIFLAFLRTAAPFGYLRIGPLSIDVGVVEQSFEARGSKVGSDYVAFSRQLMEETRRSGRKRVDALHYLFTIMKCGQGLAAEVFGELGVSPGRVEAALRQPPSEGPLDEILTPEEVAEYLKVHVETVRGWIRSGVLPASRIAGLRALRIRKTDAQALLQPLDYGAPTAAVSGE